ncbi:hypothetical protein MSAN_00872000 [Mycena sanguinolenta]|uniref:Uncharacterized protein n=1 Tax=Mycena sanguinolenta TaxID=230812 RepID=A0A8H6Z0C3_9AGAR|nr:hypothetical protein MSAN_00872000 [Mycena sanguinolenta]
MEQGEKEKGGYVYVVDSPRLHLQLHLYPYERVHARGRSSSPGRTAEYAFTATHRTARMFFSGVRPPNRSSSPHLSLRGCSEGGNDHRPTTFGNVATHVCLRTTSSAGAVLARLCVGQSGDVDQGFYTGKPVF